MSNLINKLKQLKPNKGATKKKFKKGRGIASGSGKTCSRGHRGQKCRSGWSQRAWKEGGQTPLYRRLPKHQVNSRPNRKIYTVINLSTLQSLAEKGIVDINPKTLVENGVVPFIAKYGLKVLAKGELKQAVTVSASKFSLTAKEAIEKAGGKIV